MFMGIEIHRSRWLSKEMKIRRVLVFEIRDTWEE